MQRDYNDDNYDEITIIFFRLKFTIFIKFIKNQEKGTHANFVFLPQSKNTIGWFTKTCFPRSIKIRFLFFLFFTFGKIEKSLT